MTQSKDIKEVIDQEINPQLKLHNAGCELVSLEDHIVTLRIFGGCSGCPSSTIALFNSIVKILQEKFPDIKDVHLDSND